MASVAVPTPFAVPKASTTTTPARTTVAAASTGPQIAGYNSPYTYSYNGTGGVNYYLNGAPITNTQYRSATGIDTGAIERDAASKVAGTQTGGGNVQTTLASAGSGYVGPTAAQTSPLLASLDSLDTVLNNKNDQSNSEYRRAIDSYDAQDKLDLDAKNTSVQGNEQSLTSGNQAALLNATNGATGLRGVLSSLGALGGSGLDIIKRLVGLASNSDTGNVRKTFDANAKTIGTQWAQTEQQERQRRSDADATLANSLQNNKSTVLTSRQGIYQQLANLYGADSAQGNTYASQASALAPEIAATTRATVAPYATPSSLYSPAALETYLAGTQNLNTTTSAPTSPINSPTYFLTSSNKKDQLPGVA